MGIPATGGISRLTLIVCFQWYIRQRNKYNTYFGFVWICIESVPNLVCQVFIIGKGGGSFFVH